MKKNNKLFLLLPALLVVLPATNTIINAQDEDITLDSIVTNTITSFFNGNYLVETNLSYANDTSLVPLYIRDELNSNNRVHSIYFDNNLLNEVYIFEDSFGYASQYYISIENTIKSRQLTDSSANALNFDGAFGSPYVEFCSLNNSQINNYFVITKSDDNYILKATDLAYGVFTTPLISFYVDYDSYLWDSASLSYYLDDLQLVLDNSGTPLSMSFYKIKKDKFGGIKSFYDITFTSLLELSKLNPVESSLTTEEKNTFENNLIAFQEKLNLGNFSEKIRIDKLNVSYSNYYSLDEQENLTYYPMMISDLEIYETTYGLTYLGAAKSYTEDGTYKYVQVGMSPDSDYVSTINQNSYESISNIVPLVSTLSSSFFTYKNGVYTFDIENFLYADFYFNVDILYALVGTCDTVFTILGYYMDNNDYNFKTLRVSFDTEGIPSFSLDYYMNGTTITANYTFSNIGTTNLLQIESIASVVEFFTNY